MSNYSGTPLGSKNQNREEQADLRQARADALIAAHAQVVRPSKAYMAELAQFILTGEWSNG